MLSKGRWLLCLWIFFWSHRPECYWPSLLPGHIGGSYSLPVCQHPTVFSAKLLPTVKPKRHHCREFFPGAGPCTCRVATKSLQLVIISKVFMKHTWVTQEAQPPSPPDCKALVELIFSNDFASKGYAFLLLLLFSLRSKSLLWCSEKQAYSFRELDMYPSIGRTNLSVIFLRKNITGQLKYSRGKMLDLKSAVHNFQNCENFFFLWLI